MLVKGNDTCSVESCITVQHVHNMRKLDRDTEKELITSNFW